MSTIAIELQTNLFMVLRWKSDLITLAVCGENIINMMVFESFHFFRKVSVGSSWDHFRKSFSRFGVHSGVILVILEGMGERWKQRQNFY